MYGVFLLNDDETPMEFVVYLLEHLFEKDRDEARRIMLDTHRSGRGECGVYDRAGAEAKVAEVKELVEKHHHPLQCVMEKK